MQDRYYSDGLQSIAVFTSDGLRQLRSAVASLVMTDRRRAHTVIASAAKQSRVSFTPNEQRVNISFCETIRIYSKFNRLLTLT
jgi:hypothetical protein